MSKYGSPVELVGYVTLTLYRGFVPCEPAVSLQQSHRPTSCPSLLKYNCTEFGGVHPPKPSPNCVDVVLVFRVARRSATTAAMILLAAVWEVALRFANTAMGIKAKMVIKQKAAIPIARVNSTSENADVNCLFTFDKSLRCRRSQ
jgi:hypothetical protein